MASGNNSILKFGFIHNFYQKYEFPYWETNVSYKFDLRQKSEHD